MEPKDRYTWEAETVKGEVIKEGADLSLCSRFSLIPAPGTSLPRHDLVGVKMKKRFGRGFIKTNFNNPCLPGLFYWENQSRTVKTSEDCTAHASPGDFIGKGVDGENWYRVIDVKPDHITLLTPYEGKSKPNGMQGKKLNTGIQSEYLNCVVCEGFRFYAKSDGTVLITPENYELYL